MIIRAQTLLAELVFAILPGICEVGDNYWRPSALLFYTEAKSLGIPVPLRNFGVHG